MTADQITERIAVIKNEIVELRLSGESRMSKTGVKWCISSNRDLLKRLRADLKEKVHLVE